MNTPIFDEIKKLYAILPQLNFDDDLRHCLERGYIFSGPNYFIMGEKIELGWHVNLAVGEGAIRKFGELMPHYLPFIGWKRSSIGRSATIWHHTETVFRRLNMKLTPEQQFASCRFTAANILAQYRAQAPTGFDPVAFGGGMPAKPKPPAPPTANQASQSILNQGKKRKPMGYQSTILTGDKTGSSPQGVSTILGG
jgi:hypothetical protein